MSTQEGRRALQLWEAAGGRTKKVCDECGRPIDWSRDGKLILLAAGDPPGLRVLQIPAGHIRDPLQGRKYPFQEASLSRDGQWIAVRTEAMEEGCPAIFLAPFAEGSFPSRCTEWISLVELGPVSGLRWSPDGGWLFFFSRVDGFSCIWRQRLDPATKRPVGKPGPVHHFHRYQKYPIADSGIAVAGDRLAVWLGESASSIWMAETATPATR